MYSFYSEIENSGFVGVETKKRVCLLLFEAALSFYFYLQVIQSERRPSVCLLNMKKSLVSSFWFH